MTWPLLYPSSTLLGADQRSNTGHSAHIGQNDCQIRNAGAHVKAPCGTKPAISASTTVVMRSFRHDGCHPPVLGCAPRHSQRHVSATSPHAEESPAKIRLHSRFSRHSATKQCVAEYRGSQRMRTTRRAPIRSIRRQETHGTHLPQPQQVYPRSRRPLRARRARRVARLERSRHRAARGHRAGGYRHRAQLRGQRRHRHARAL